MTSGATKLDPNWMRMVELRASAMTSAGMSSLATAKSSNRLHYAILTILDTVFSALVAAPAVVGYWRGTWGLSDLYVYPDEPIFSSFASIAIGFAGLFAFSVLQHGLDDALHPDKHRLSYYLGSRLYTGVFGFCCVNAWRGAWKGLDIYTDHTASTVFATTAVSLLALGIMRAIRNISAPPFALCLDSCPGYFEVQTMFRVNNTRDWSLYLLDCAFSVGVVGTLVVFVWRGVWILFDIYLFPENEEYSAVGSLAIGYSIVAVTFCLQPLMRYVCARLQGLVRLVVADIFLLLSFLGTVNVWRGIWVALDLWLLPDNPELSCWITHIGCFVFLVLLNCSNSILVRGVYIDAEEEEGKCVVFPCHYLRLFFKIEHEKKETRRQKLLVASQDFNDGINMNGKDSEDSILPLENTTIIPMNTDSVA
ncbi:uncharacterized protein LOC105187771 [Harpegnathos saltator]|uniref:Uncharacterized protein n=1 Tax=Harpegnathos saltator TaxID=610380 RepID=E2BXV9_HARSA|nr:uncharacterized protein LOC105187771 [Harpegnathos saltator]XP_011147072.1 uncharacterized protein LOC105187771 [Harpegnathos saltator]EFN79473.1 hypothetical protein EAI_15294 [Harpegnathos saltator]